jgi:chorismate mutase
VTASEASTASPVQAAEAARGEHGGQGGQGGPAAAPVRIGHEVVGGTRLPVFAGPDRGAQVVHWSMRSHHGAPSARTELARVRDLSASPLVVEPFSAADLEDIATYGDGILVGAAWMQDFRLLSAVGRVGLPVVVQRGNYITVDEWLSAVEYVVASGCDDVVLCETGSRTHLSTSRPTIDLALIREVRERSGRPVVVDVSHTPHLAAAAVSAGADGVFLAENAETADVDAALNATTLLTPVVRPVNPANLSGCREAIDRVDATLATLLEYRATLAGEVQKHKPVGGHAGRDARREREIVRQMAARAPRLGADRLSAIMSVVIETGLDLAAAGEASGGTTPPR